MNLEEPKRERRHRNKSRPPRLEERNTQCNSRVQLPPVSSKGRPQNHIDISDIMNASNLDAKIIQDMKAGSCKLADSERKLSSRSAYNSIMDISKRSARSTKTLAPLSNRANSGDGLKPETVVHNGEETPSKVDGIYMSERIVSRENSSSKTLLDSKVHRKSSKLKSVGDKKLLARDENSDSARKLIRKTKLTSMEENIVGLTVSRRSNGFKLNRSKWPNIGSRQIAR